MVEFWSHGKDFNIAYIQIIDVVKNPTEYAQLKGLVENYVK